MEMKDPEKNKALMPSESSFLLYTTEDGKAHIQVKLQDETVWLTQAQMAELFQTTQQNVSLHIQHIFESAELDIASTHKKYLSVRREGSRDIQRNLDFYNRGCVLKKFSGKRGNIPNRG